MLLKLSLPRIDQTAEKVAVVRWHKQAGDRVAFGDPLLDLEIRSMRRSRVDERPRSILRFGRRREAGGAGHERSWTMDVAIPVRVTSVDFGIMRRACASVGEVLEPGDLLALFATEDDDTIREPEAAAIASAAELRATTDYVALS